MEILRQPMPLGESCASSSETGCGFHLHRVAATPARSAAESRQRARVRVTTPQVDTNIALR
jgi:hypothetical protein